MARKTVCAAASQAALYAIEESHDFFGGSYVAIRLLQREVAGIRSAHPEVTQPEIATHLQLGAQAGGTNAFNLVERRDWGGVVALHRQMRLMNLVSIYEAWDSALGEELGFEAADQERLTAYLQQGSPAATPLELFGPLSPALKEVRQVARSHPHFEQAHLAQLRRCYRAFKEVRNSLAHAGNRASKRTEKAWKAYENVRPNWRAGLSKAPHLAQVRLGSPISLTDDGLIAFSRVLQMMIVTIDAEMGGREVATRVFEDRWQRGYGRKVTLSPDRQKATTAFLSRWNKLQLPQLDKSDALFEHFRASGLVF